MRVILFCLLVFNITQSTYASLQWHEGVIVLHNNHILVGKVAVEPVHDLILFSHPDSIRITVFPAHKIKAANFYDVDNNINRRFMSIEVQGIKTEYRLYEVVVRGIVWVLRRPDSNHLTPLRDDEYTYFSWGNGELTALKKFGTTIYSRLDSLSGRQLSSYARSQHFDPYLQADAIRIIQYFNSLEIPVLAFSKK